MKERRLLESGENRRNQAQPPCPYRAGLHLTANLPRILSTTTLSVLLSHCQPRVLLVPLTSIERYVLFIAAPGGE
jgi:hypothetical protein